MLTWYGVGAVPVIIGLIEVLKLSLNLPAKAAPLTATVLAIGISIAIGAREGAEIVESIFNGLIIGMTAMGLYSGTKTSKEWVGGGQ